MKKILIFLIMAILPLKALAVPAASQVGINIKEAKQKRFEPIREPNKRILYPNYKNARYLCKKINDDSLGLSDSINHVLNIKTFSYIRKLEISPIEKDWRFFFERGDTFFILALTPKAYSYTQRIAPLHPDKKDYWLSGQKMTTEANALLRLNAIKKIPAKVIIPDEIKGWKLGNIFLAPNEFRYEFIPKNQQIYDFKDKYAIELFDTKFAKTLDEYLAKYKKFNEIFAKDLDLKYYEKITPNGQNSVIYEWGYGDGYENVISVVTKTPDGCHRVAYTKMSTLTNADREKWVKITNEEMKRQLEAEKKTQ